MADKAPCRWREVNDRCAHPLVMHLCGGSPAHAVCHGCPCHEPAEPGHISRHEALAASRSILLDAEAERIAGAEPAKPKEEPNDAE